MMDAMSDPSVMEVTLKTSSQVGKTASLENALGYFIDQDPCRVIMMHPTAGDCKDWSMSKFEPMIESCPDLLSKVAPPRSRNSVNTKTKKEYPGGFIMLIGSNVTRAMRGRSAPKIFCDEIDDYEISPEGDPIDLLKRRSATFPNKLLVRTSTPTFEESSRISDAYEASDKRKYWVPCPHCGTFQVLVWKQIK